MKLTIKKNELEKAIQWVSRTISKNLSNPLLAGIKLRITENSIKFSSYDYSQSSEYILNIKTNQKAEILFYGMGALDIVKQLKGDDIQIEKKENKLIFSSGLQEYGAGIMPINEYPELPTIPESVGEISAQTLLSSCEHVAFAAYKDETLPMLTGVNLSFKNKNTISFTATDKSRLAIKISPISMKKNINLSALVKASVLLEIVKSFDEDEAISIHLNEKDPDIIGFSTKEKVTTALLIDRPYPEVESVIPKDNNIIAEFNKEKLLTASKGISIVAGKEATMHLHLEKNKATIETSSMVEESSGIEVVDVNYNSEKEIDIYFMPSYFKEGVDSISTENLVIKFNNEKTPVVFFETENSKISNEFVYVLVPFVK